MVLLGKKGFVMDKVGLVRADNTKDIVYWLKPEETRPGIDWDCPCLAGVKEGPCGQLFMDALDCHIKSSSPQNGCIEKFMKMTDCMREHPKEYAEFLNILDGKE